MAKRPAKSAGGDDGDSMLAPPPAPVETPPVHALTMLDQVIGQAQARKVLQSALASGRVHHAWIFHGPAGVGKLTAAVAFAAALLDPTTAPDLGGNLAPEPDSPVQKLVREGRHPDLHVITKELAAISRNDQVRKGKQQNIAKDVIEEFLIEPATKSRSLQGASPAGKVFIVDEAELMAPPSQNALLKTLEEPAPGTVIILITSAEERLLPTIRSRAQRVPFVPLEETDMLKWLSRRSGPAGIGAVEPGKRQWLTRFACGSPGAAEVALANDLFAWEQALKPALDQVEAGKYPIGAAAMMAAMVDERAAASVKGRPEASKDAANKAWARRLLSFVGEDLRSRLRARTVKKTAAEVEADAAAQRLLNAIDAVAAAEGYLAMNVNLAMVVENLVAQMASEPIGSI
jgi:DNA polymerase-3 subunit delta'